MLLSIIIPVYNCAHLITRCVESIVNQKINDYEIILVNDGSKDNSLEVCHQLAKKHAQIIVLSQNNQGTATARNTGLTKSSGNYVWFVDADDYITKDCLSHIFETLKKNKIEALTFNYRHILSSGIQDIKLYLEETDIPSVNFLEFSPCMFTHTKIYNKRILEQIHFKDGLKNIEDFLFNIEVFSKIKLIHIIPISVYNYDQTNENSTSLNRSKRNLVKLSNDSMTVHQIIKEKLAKISDSDLHRVIENQLNYSIAGHLYSLINYYNIKRLKNIINKYTSLGLYPIKKTNNKRANIFIGISNCKPLLYLIAYYFQIKRIL